MSQVSANIISLSSDLIIAIDGIQVSSPMTGYQLASSNQDYWIQKSLLGEDCLCTNLVEYTNAIFTMENSYQVNYICDCSIFLNTHPIHRPK